MAVATGVGVSGIKWGWRRRDIDTRSSRPRSPGEFRILSLIINAQKAMKVSVREGPDPVCV